MSPLHMRTLGLPSQGVWLNQAWFQFPWQGSHHFCISLMSSYTGGGWSVPLGLIYPKVW